MLIYIVRHGETKSNEEGYLQGWSDDPLNSNGVDLAEITGKGMREIKFDECISSPLKRARQTAEIILKNNKHAVPMYFDNRIMEINMGSWERKKFRPGECEVDAVQLRTFFTDPFSFAGYPGGESIYDVCKRTQSFLKEIIARDDGKTYLVTTHGFALRAMLHYLYENSEDFWHGHVPYNCSVNVIEANNGNVRIIEDDMIYYDKNNVVDRYAKF